ncbi:MAG TPA: conjugative transposon protein TraN [Cyclobacteriaceae bacterium]|jgi:conjugative transposon TraN protein|nr:conjugative transposon protein TraN [Cyclobacteriaceae bacterium]
MKTIIYACAMMLLAKSGFCQWAGEGSQPLQITYNKTTNIIFPSVIKSVDRGSRDILAQKARQVENVLQVKADKKFFLETSLTVITSDGELHNFIVSYSDTPSQLNWFIDSEQVEPKIMLTRSIDEKSLEMQSTSILSDKRWMLLKNSGKYGIKLSLFGIYVNGNVMFYRLQLSNKTNIDYDIESLRFYVIDKLKARRTASQEIEMTPIHLSGNTNSTIKGQSEMNAVYTLDKFTIPEAKRLVIEVLEQKGGRHLKLHIKNSAIVSARPVPL